MLLSLCSDGFHLCGGCGVGSFRLTESEGVRLSKGFQRRRHVLCLVFAGFDCVVVSSAVIALGVFAFLPPRSQT